MTNQLNQYKFDEIKIGLEYKFKEKITESCLDSFASLSGDYNPLHTDDGYAKTTKFKRRVCHGMLLASFFSKLIGMYLPGKNALYFSQILNFQNPCFVDDTITVRGQVIDKSDATKIIILNTSIHNQDGMCLVDGTAKVMIRQD